MSAAPSGPFGWEAVAWALASVEQDARLAGAASKAKRRSRSRTILPKPSSDPRNQLGSYGYTTKISRPRRRAALLRAIRNRQDKRGRNMDLHDSMVSVMRRVNLLSVYNKRNPATHRILEDDKRWLLGMIRRARSAKNKTGGWSFFSSTPKMPDIEARKFDTKYEQDKENEMVEQIRTAWKKKLADKNYKAPLTPCVGWLGNRRAGWPKCSWLEGLYT